MWNLAAGGELPSDPLFENDGVAMKEDRLEVERVDIIPVSIGGGNGNVFSLEKLLKEEDVAGKPPYLRKRQRLVLLVFSLRI